MSSSNKKKVLKPPKQRKQLSEFEKGQIVAWSRDGQSGVAIGKLLNRHHSVINQFLRRFRKSHDYHCSPGSGRKRKTTRVLIASLSAKHLKALNLTGIGPGANLTHNHICHYGTHHVTVKHACYVGGSTVEFSAVSHITRWSRLSPS